MNVDERGSFTELVHTHNAGQVSINISRPGITKGQHWHNTKFEQFIVVKGHGLIQQRSLNDPDGKILEWEVDGDHIQAVHMLPVYTHNIISLSDTEDPVTVMYCNEVFNPNRPDTFSFKSSITKNEVLESRNKVLGVFVILVRHRNLKDKIMRITLDLADAVRRSCGCQHRSLRTPHRHCQWNGKVAKGREQRCSLFLCPSDGIGIGRTPLFDHRHVYEKTLNGRRVSKGFILPHCCDQ